MSIKNKNREIELVEGQYRNSVFKSFMQGVNNRKFFVSLIPFVRNIVEYTEGKESKEYKILTCCLHLKDESSGINANNILDIYKSNFSNCSENPIDFGDKNIIDLVIEVADNILTEDINEILLENKIVLSIAIRLKAESYMKCFLPEFTPNNSNQTSKLFKEFKKKYEKDEEKKEKLLILDKVNLMTPENIHINAFMYEPLIDISVYHLIDLYNDVKKL